MQSFTNLTVLVRSVYYFFLVKLKARPTDATICSYRFPGHLRKEILNQGDNEDRDAKAYEILQ